MKMKSTKRALLMSALSLLLCCSMLIGTTFAWFTDTVESGKNKIVAGNLDIELEYAKVENGSITGWDTVAGKTNIFDPDALWEPGRVEVVYLKVSNLGTLELKYQLGVNVSNETPGTNVYNETFLLSNSLVFKVVDLDEEPTVAYTREEAMKAAGTEKGLKDYNGKTTELDAKDGANDEDYVALIVYMPTTVGNEANYKTGTAAPVIELGINLFATQKDAESDSFGNDYDEDAWHPDMKVYNAQDLQAAVENAQPGDVIELQNNIDLSESLVIPAAAATYSMRSIPAPVVIDLNGKTLTGTVGSDAEGNRVHVVVNNGNAIIKNGTVKSADFDGGSAIYNGEGAALTLEKVTALGAPQKNNVYPVSAYPAYAINNYGDLVVNGATVKSYHGAIATGGNGTAVINDVTIDVGMGNSTGITSYAIYAFGNGEVTINGGNFAFTKQEVYVNGGNMFCELGSKPIVINGGTFVGGGFSQGDGREYVIKGGAFSFDPSAYVASGYKVENIDGVYYVVADNVAGVVTKPEALKDALSSAGAAGAGDTTIAFFGDINMTGTTWTPIKVDGYNGADIVTIEGNGATITGLTAPLFAGGFAGGSGIVIKDLTIADSNIVSSNTIGSGAFIESVDSMALITLENCHLVNSTVTGGSGSRTGGLIGWTAGYNNVNDGPVKTYVNITNCSVVGCTITCDGSVGGIYGHAGNNAWTYSKVENCVVKNNKLISTDDGGWRVGVVVGTANVGELTISNITESGNTLTQTGKTAPAGQSNLYGRFVPVDTGKLVIDGSSIVATSEALKAVNGGNVALTGTVDLGGTTGNYLTLTEDTTVTGGTIKGTGWTGEMNYAVNATSGDIVFDGVTFDTTGWTTVGWANWGMSVNVSGNANVTFKNCTFKGTQCPIYQSGADSVIVLENCTFESTVGAIQCEIYSGDFSLGQDLIVKNCVFTGMTDVLHIYDYDKNPSTDAIVNYLTDNGNTFTGTCKQTCN